MLSETNPAGFKTKYKYDSNTGKLWSTTDPNGLTTITTYDVMGKPNGQIMPDGNIMEKGTGWAEECDDAPDFDSVNVVFFTYEGFAVNLMLAREVYISGYFVDSIQKLSSTKFSKLLILLSLGLFNFVYLFFYEINSYNKIFTFIFCFPVLNLYFYIGIVRKQVQKGEDLHSILKKYFKLQLISYVIKKEGL